MQQHAGTATLGRPDAGSWRSVARSGEGPPCVCPKLSACVKVGKVLGESTCIYQSQLESVRLILWH
eukprot:1603242-Amphidinium_carterae.1